MLAQELVQGIVDETEQLFAGGPYRGEDLHCGQRPRRRAVWTDINREKTSCAGPSRFDCPRHSEAMTAAIHIPGMLRDSLFDFRLGHVAPRACPRLYLEHPAELDAERPSVG